MIIDIPRFVATERPYWQELEAMLGRLEAEPISQFTLDEIKRFHFLFERSAADLARITPQAEPETHKFLESLVVRAYGEIHETRDARTKLRPLHWFFQTLPQTFRRHIRAFALSVGITAVGILFGSLAVALDPDAKRVIMPFEHLLEDPAERVAHEEAEKGDHMRGHKSAFSADLMTHNTQVSIFALALGMTWGVGTIVLLFSNGVMLGAIALDYVRAGQTEFLLGWLLPHGSIEVPAFLIAGQAGLMLAGAVIGWGGKETFGVRLRAIGADIVTLIAGVALLLVWAGFVESFLSQYHAPVFPYWAKITLGSIELVLLTFFLLKSGAPKAKA